MSVCLPAFLYLSIISLIKRFVISLHKLHTETFFSNIACVLNVLGTAQHPYPSNIPKHQHG